MQITRLRLSGFKSFVEPSEFQIEPGLTGIVGPNGCGKSNLVDALRWVMGENSARKVRGSAMEDVIFSGTAARPGRSHAEVALHIDNSERRVPPPFNDAVEVEVTRRIEREAGSIYRINGREVRARDVQLVFADLNTGAHSVSMVSQGRVEVLVQAKPTDRRVLLEEAAGITGLHSRRHEAELRLGAATTNLERLGDVIAQLENQLQGLKRLARQASRYRSISTRIREAEATLFRLRHRAALAQLAETQARKAESLRAVAEKTETATAAFLQKEQVAERLPALRERAAETSAALHRLTVAREGLDEEAARIADEIRRLDQRSLQIAADIEREQNQSAAARAAEARLDEETENLNARAEEAVAAQAQAATAHQEAVAGAAEKAQAFEALTAHAARQAAQRESLNQELRRIADHLARLARKAEEIVAEEARLAAEAQAAQTPAEGVLAEQRAQCERRRREREALEAERHGAESDESAARDRYQEADLILRRLAAEEKGLLRLLEASEKSPWPPMIGQITVASGYEAALAAALGDELQAAEDPEAPAYWKTLPPLAEIMPLPAEAEPLSRFVEAPAALARRLAAIGIVSDEAGPALAAKLLPGQRLVSRSGGLWRWDGFTVKPGAPSTAALRLEHQNRLKSLRQEMAQAEQVFRQADAIYGAAKEKRAAARAAHAEAETRLREAEAALRRAEAEAAKAAEEASARAIRRDALETAKTELARERTEAGERQAIAEEALRALPDEARLGQEVAVARQLLQAAREAESQAQSRVNDLRREAAARDERRAAVQRERAAWAAQGGNAARQIEELRRRESETADELAKRRAAPEAIAVKRAALLDQITAMEANGREASDALAAAENGLRESERAAKLAQDELAAARETHARAEAETAHAEQALEELRARIRETFEEGADDVLSGAGDDEAVDVAQAEARFERLRRERDAMGPVNLRAEIEAAEVEEQLANLGRERADLEAAIARLRQGISSLNREGRERLLEAFDKVNGHFRELFVKAFGGGEAHLKLVDSDDPLTAGLELYAQPPGKKLQSLSLLSGGEQALTALSLIFAVFLTSPAPLCVLDEVDAPLDDANTERLCDLLEDLSRSTRTRFLVVTHQPLTMARMDRLYGVTMQERGVSQLVSVDLAAAEAMRQSA